MTDTSLSEDRRQFYLGAAGVRMWYAKRPLPGAAPSPDYVFPEPSVAAYDQPVPSVNETANEASYGFSTAPEPAPRESVPAASPIDLQALMAPKADNLPAQTESTPEVDPPYGGDTLRENEAKAAATEESDQLAGLQKRAVAEDIVPASLALWSNDRYLLVSQWSENASERLQSSLAESILKALHPSEVTSRQNMFWPVFRNLQVPGNSPEDFQTVLASIFSSYGDLKIVFLGVMADQSEDTRRRWLLPQWNSIAVDFPHSLTEISTAGTHKRDLWQTLRSRFGV